MGAPLTEALLALQERGLKLVFSSRVVLPEMRVLAEPVATELRSLLDELLAPHDLAVEEQEGGSLVVVSAGKSLSPSALRGQVRSRRALTPVAGAGVRVVETGIEVQTDREGRYEIQGMAPGTWTIEARRPGFVVEERHAVELAPGTTLELSFLLQPAPLAAEEIAVHPSRISLLAEQPASPFALSRDEILALPHLGGDVFRALSLLPGTTANDVSAQFHVRGGRRDEVLILLDGQELYEAYHLKDFDNALSAVPAAELASLDLSTGAFPSSYGDRMGGIVEMSSIAASPTRHFLLSASVLNAQLESSGTLNDRLGFLVSARRGTTDLAADFFNKAEDPSFWDLFAKLDYRVSPRQSLRGNLLHSADRLHFTETLNDELRRLDTEYRSSYLWLTHQAILSERLFVDSAGSASSIYRDRQGGEDEEEKRFEVLDRRDLAVVGLLQSWNFQATPRSFLRAGFELRRFTADYDYWSDRTFFTPFAELRAEPQAGIFAFQDAVSDDYLGAYFSDRWRPLARLTLELGLRYDRHTLTEDSLVSPRLNLAWAVGTSSVLRLGWGHFHQSQRAYELMVEDGDTRFYPAERSEHWVAGFERLFNRAAASRLVALRAELYWRRITDPRPRYESLFEPFEPLTEGELDRYRIEPEEGSASGLEIFLQGRIGERFDWWINYGYAIAEDTVAGNEIFRQTDQRHTINLDLSYRFRQHWEANLAWRFHTGWPTTPVSLVEREVDDGEESEEGEEDEEGEEGATELVPVLGPINSERLADYHRLDLRVSRKWLLDRGQFTFFLDVQNLYNRQNLAGFDLEIDEEAARINAQEEEWPGFFASLGVSWEF